MTCSSIVSVHARNLYVNFNLVVVIITSFHAYICCVYNVHAPIQTSVHALYLFAFCHHMKFLCL
ncbi:hypothetical protein ACE6H2_004296 [Prunus campanulata]